MLRKRGLLPILALLGAILGVWLWHLRVSARCAALNAKLFQAVAEDDAAAVERLLREGANPNAKESDFAVMWGNAPNKAAFLNPANWSLAIGLFRSRTWEACPPIFFVKDPEVARHFQSGEMEKLCSLDFHFKEVHHRFEKVGL